MSFNNIVASKAPKNCHYSKSESLDFRIASIVCQKNVGETYLKVVNEEMNLSPGKVNMKIGEGIERTGFLKRQRKKIRIETVA